MEQEILALLKAREERAIPLLKEKYGQRLRYIVSGILRDRSDEEECLNDIYLQVWEKWAQFDPKRGSLLTYLTAIARNMALNRLKSRKSTEPLEVYGELSHEDSPERLFLEKEDLEKLKKAIETLGLEERILFYRKYYYLQSTAQIAGEMGLSERAVEGRLYRIRKKLQEAWKGGGAE